VQTHVSVSLQYAVNTDQSISPVGVTGNPFASLTTGKSATLLVNAMVIPLSIETARSVIPKAVSTIRKACLLKSFIKSS
jgi:hypothetical protein